MVDQAGDEGLLGDARRLAGDEQGQGEEVERQVVQRERHADDERGADHEERRGDEAVAAGEAVDGRTDERCEERERDEVDHEVEQHLLARRVRGDAEEQRPGERHVDEGVRRRGHAVGGGEAVETHRRVGPAPHPRDDALADPRHGPYVGAFP